MLHLKKFTPTKKNLHGRHPWRPWQIWGMNWDLLETAWWPMLSVRLNSHSESSGLPRVFTDHWSTLATAILRHWSTFLLELLSRHLCPQASPASISAGEMHQCTIVRCTIALWRDAPLHWMGEMHHYLHQWMLNDSAEEGDWTAGSCRGRQNNV